MKIRSIYSILILCLMTSVSMGGEFTNYGKILFQSADTWVPVNRVCRVSSYLYHKDQAYVEKVRCYGKDQDNCEVWDRRELKQAVNSLRDKCSRFVQGDCVEFEPAALIQGINAGEAKIYRSRKGFEEGEAPVDSFLINIPSCR